MDEVLSVNNPSHPLFGRRIELIKMKRLPPYKSKEFLKLGFKETNLSISDSELDRAVGILDGLIGWLTLYGYERAIAGNIDAIDRVKGIALSIVNTELKNFLSKKRNKELYISILKYARKRRWKELLSVVRDDLGKVDNSSFSRALKELISYSFLENENNYYVQADPMIWEAAIRL